MAIDDGLSTMNAAALLDDLMVLIPEESAAGASVIVAAIVRKLAFQAALLTAMAKKIRNTPGADAASRRWAAEAVACVGKMKEPT